MTKRDRGFELTSNQGKLQVELISEEVLHVRFFSESGGANLAHESLSVLDVEVPDVQFELRESDDAVVLTTSKLQVRVNVSSRCLEFLDAEGNSLLKEGKRTLEPITCSGEEAVSITQCFDWKEAEALYGLGQHQDVECKLNYRGLDVHLFQGNLKASAPVLLSSEGYGLLWDNYSYTKFDDSGDNSYIWSEIADGINYYFILGPEFDTLIKHVRFLTGKCPMFPKWAFGYIQCKERYKNETEIVEVVKEYRRRKIPLDLIVQDWRYWGSILQWGNKKFKAPRFAHPTRMIEQIHDLNAKIMISIWPLMSVLTSDYKEMKKRGFLYDRRVMGIMKVYDAFNAEARDLFWKQANDGLFKHGIDAWWCDSTEPMPVELARGGISKDKFVEKSVELLKEVMKKTTLGPGARYLNAYSLMQSKGMYENQRKTTSEKRVVNLTRSGFTGQQRFGTITWSGDVPATWEYFKAQIPAGLNFSMTGQPYWTTDIGAFHLKSKPMVYLMKGVFPNGNEDLGYREYYTRWFQFGAFTPLFRSHGTDTPKEVWQFGEPGTMFYDTLVKFIKLRYRLLSYVYSLAGMVSQRDYTMMRSLAFDFREDAKVLDINDQFMFGPAFLVCPVLEPMYHEAGSKPIEGVEKTRSVYLPEGTDWHDFWTGERHEGGQTITADAPIDIIPLFIRAGSIVPFNPAMQHATEKPPDPLELRIYPGADGSFTLYEDENDNYNYENGSFSMIEFRWVDAERKLVIGSRKGTFPGMLKHRTFKIVLIDEKNGLGIQENTEFDGIIEYDGNSANFVKE